LIGVGIGGQLGGRRAWSLEICWGQFEIELDTMQNQFSTSRV